MKKLCFILFVSTSVISISQTEVENLGKNVNSEYKDLSPVISADGKTLFNVVADHPLNTMQVEKGKSQDIWYNEKDERGNWGPSIHAEAPLNDLKNNNVVWVSPDGNKILIKGFYEDGRYKSQGFSFCHRKKNGWSKPEGIFIPRYKEMNEGKSATTFFNNDGKLFIFSFSEIKDGKANSLYFSKISQNGKWTEPQLIKKFSDPNYTYVSPFLASDGVTLYFSSNRPGGLGSNDIWMSKRLDDTWQNWSEPLNLGAPVNTEKWDAYFTLDASGEYAYMTSNFNSHGGSDIVRVKLKKEEKPEPVVLVHGNVYNAKTKEPLSADLVYETLPDNTNAGLAQSSEVDGGYKIVLPYGKLYSFRASSGNFISVSDNLDLQTVDGYKEIKRDLYLVPIEKGQTIRLNNIFFDFGKASLRPESFPELDRLVDLLNANSKMVIEMSGHTDNVGNDESNLRLSEDRAKAVTEYLISKGIKGKRIMPKGYGESKPAAGNDTEEGRQLNRRVEFTIL